MANLTIDNTLYISGVTGNICTYDLFHQIVMRGDMCCTSVNRMAFYEYGDTLANCGGYRFHTGTTSQPLKFSVANDASYFADPIMVGTTNVAYHQGFMDHAVNIVGNRPGINLENTTGTLSTIRLKGTCSTGEIHLNYDGSGTESVWNWYSYYYSGGQTIFSFKGSGKLGIGSSSPEAKLHICNAVAANTDNFLVIVQNCCTVSGARAGIAFSNNSQTPSAGGLSGASIQTSNNGIDGTGNLLFGTLTSGANTERMRISYDGKIGIGTSTPCVALHVSGIGLIRNGGTDTSGCRAGGLTVDIAGCAYAGVDLQDVNRHITLTSNVDNRAVALTLRNLSRGRFWDIVNEGTGTDKLLFNTWCNTAAGYFNRVTIEGSTGNMGINTCTPGTYKLNVNGSFYSAGSSCEYKTQICNYNTDSCMFMKLKPVTYQYKDEYCHLGKELKSGTQIGLIAEDTAEVFPELAILKEEENEKVVRNVDYEKLTIILLSELQKLRQEVDQLKNK